MRSSDWHWWPEREYPQGGSAHGDAPNPEPKRPAGFCPPPPKIEKPPPAYRPRGAR